MCNLCVWQISLHPLTDHSRRKTAPSNVHSASCFNCNLSDLIATSCPRQCFATFDKPLVIFLRSSFVTGKCGISVAVFNRKVFLWGVHCNPPLIGIWPSEQWHKMPVALIPQRIQVSRVTCNGVFLATIVTQLDFCSFNLSSPCNFIIFLGQGVVTDA